MLVTLADALVSLAKGSLLALEHFHPKSTTICSGCSQRPKRGRWGQEGAAGTWPGLEGAIHLSGVTQASGAEYSLVPTHVS